MNEEKISIGSIHTVEDQNMNRTIKEICDNITLAEGAMMICAKKVRQESLKLFEFCHELWPGSSDLHFSVHHNDDGTHTFVAVKKKKDDQ